MTPSPEPRTVLPRKARNVLAEASTGYVFSGSVNEQARSDGALPLAGFFAAYLVGALEAEGDWDHEAMVLAVLLAAPGGEPEEAVSWVTVVRRENESAALADLAGVSFPEWDAILYTDVVTRTGGLPEYRRVVCVVPDPQSGGFVDMAVAWERGGEKVYQRTNAASEWPEVIASLTDALRDPSSAPTVVGRLPAHAPSTDSGPPAPVRIRISTRDWQVVQESIRSYSFAAGVDAVEGLSGSGIRDALLEFLTLAIERDGGDWDVETMVFVAVRHREVTGDGAVELYWRLIQVIRADEASSALDELDMVDLSEWDALLFTNVDPGDGPGGEYRVTLVMSHDDNSPNATRVMYGRRDRRMASWADENAPDPLIVQSMVAAFARSDESAPTPSPRSRYTPADASVFVGRGLEFGFPALLFAELEQGHGGDASSAAMATHAVLTQPGGWNLGAHLFAWYDDETEPDEQGLGRPVVHAMTVAHAATAPEAMAAASDALLDGWRAIVLSEIAPGEHPGGETIRVWAVAPPDGGASGCYTIVDTRDADTSQRGNRPSLLHVPLIAATKPRDTDDAAPAPASARRATSHHAVTDSPGPTATHVIPGHDHYAAIASATGGRWFWVPDADAPTVAERIATACAAPDPADGDTHIFGVVRLDLAGEDGTWLTGAPAGATCVWAVVCLDAMIDLDDLDPTDPVAALALPGWDGVVCAFTALRLDSSGGAMDGGDAMHVVQANLSPAWGGVFALVKRVGADGVVEPINASAPPLGALGDVLG